jgi:two-component system, NarL family, invasion response regulator UvrY
VNPLIRVYLADDHAMFRRGIRALLAESRREITVVGEAATGDALLAGLSLTPADVVVLDISMPGPGVLEILRRLRQEHSDTKVVILSLYDEAQYAVRTLRAGASGYLTKERSPEDLVKAIRQAHAGGPPFVTSAVRGRIEEPRRDPASGDQPPHLVLSAREYDVLRLLGRGKSIKEISERMGLSPKTVSTFRSRILRKMAFKGNADIVRYVVDAGLDP